jgi:hypothetical protein
MRGWNIRYVLNAEQLGCTKHVVISFPTYYAAELHFRALLPDRAQQVRLRHYLKWRTNHKRVQDLFAKELAKIRRLSLFPTKS